MLFLTDFHAYPRFHYGIYYKSAKSNLQGFDFMVHFNCEKFGFPGNGILPKPRKKIFRYGGQNYGKKSSICGDDPA